MSYEIKPLKWKKYYQDWRQSWSAATVFGSVSVERLREDCDEERPWMGWAWKYCFTEYYDDGEQNCDSVKDGKQKAEAFYLSRLTPALNQIKEQPERNLRRPNEDFGPCLWPTIQPKTRKKCGKLVKDNSETFLARVEVIGQPVAWLMEDKIDPAMKWVTLDEAYMNQKREAYIVTPLGALPPAPANNKPPAV